MDDTNQLDLGNKIALFLPPHPVRSTPNHPPPPVLREGTKLAATAVPSFRAASAFIPGILLPQLFIVALAIFHQSHPDERLRPLIFCSALVLFLVTLDPTPYIVRGWPISFQERNMLCVVYGYVLKGYYYTNVRIVVSTMCKNRDLYRFRTRRSKEILFLRRSKSNTFANTEHIRSTK